MAIAIVGRGIALELYTQVHNVLQNQMAKCGILDCLRHLHFQDIKFHHLILLPSRWIPMREIRGCYFWAVCSPPWKRPLDTQSQHQVHSMGARTLFTASRNLTPAKPRDSSKRLDVIKLWSGQKKIFDAVIRLLLIK